MTVRRENIVTKWDGKLIIDELVQIDDSRGWLTELWRSDDEIVNEDDNPVQCYFSETNPFVMRGPHEHVNQTDYFVTMKSTMVYEFFNMETKEFFFYKTDPKKVTRLKVAPPVVHGYRNVECRPTIAGNFTSSLFGGYKRQEEVDEIRHEQQCHEKKKVLIVFGATGRLGKSLVESAYRHIGFYDYEVIPIFSKIHFEDQAHELLENIRNAISPDREVYFINAAGCTDTKSPANSAVFWTNSQLPSVFGRICDTFKWKFIQFSSDYVFQSTKKYNFSLSAYTKSKQMMEDALIDDEIPATVIRVANLFSDEENDLKNMIQKFATKVRLGETFVIDPRIIVAPTDVRILSDFLIDNIVNEKEAYGKLFGNKQNFINVLPEDTYNLRDFIAKYYDGYDNIEEKEGLIEPWFDKFNSAGSIRIPSSEQTIINTLRKHVNA